MGANSLEIDRLVAARKRARYRSWHRGTKELDYILGRFGDVYIEGFNEEQLADFERLMENEETNLQAWLMGQQAIPEGQDEKLLHRIRDFHISNVDKNGENA